MNSNDRSPYKAPQPDPSCRFSILVRRPRNAECSDRKCYRGQSSAFRLDLASAFAQIVSVARASITSPSITCLPCGQPERQSEPPELATEINARRGVYRAPNPPSPVRIRQTPTPKTLRNRGLFRRSRQVLARVRRTQSLGGGGRSRAPARLSPQGGNSNRTALPAGGGTRERTRLCWRFTESEPEIVSSRT
jgi:hypothetical protein